MPSAFHGGLRPSLQVCRVRGRRKSNVSGAPFPFTQAVNVGSMPFGDAFRQRAGQWLGNSMRALERN